MSDLHPPKPTRATLDADREVRRLHAAECGLFDQLRAARQAIKSADASLADAALAGATGDTSVPPDTAALTAAQAGLRAADTATDEARKRRGAAILHLRKAQAADCRAEAQSKRVEADKRQQKTDWMLADLAAFEGCDFGPAHIGTYVGIEQPAFAVPKTAQMLAQAAGLERDADELERRPVDRNGVASGSSVAEVLAAAQADPFVIGPRLDAIEAKAQELQAAEQARRARLQKYNPDFVAEDAPFAFEIAWRDGVVNDRTSRCTSPASVAA